MIKKLIEHVISHLVDQPNEVSIMHIQDGQKTMVQIRVDQNDLKRVIGKEGRMIKAIRAMVGALVSGPYEVILEAKSS